MRSERIRSIGCAILIGSLAVPVSTQAQTDPDPSRFESEIEQFRQIDARNTPPRDGVLFVGSSSIRLWRTAAAFPENRVINRGFGGAHISDVNHFVRETVLRYSSPAIFFYCGDNDVWDGKSLEQVLEDFKGFLAFVRSTSPSTVVHFIAIKPSPSRWSAWDEMRRINETVAEMAARDDRLVYVDVATPMLDEATRPDSSLFVPDMLHLNERGYRLWESVMRPFLNPYTDD